MKLENQEKLEHILSVNNPGKFQLIHS